MDAQGASVPEATVSARNVGQNTVTTVKTDVSGNFLFTQMLPATYTIGIEKQGFNKYEQSNIVLTANTNISVGSITLQVGAVGETISVVAQGEQLQTETAERGTSIVGTQLANIQVNGRSYLSLLRTVPGMYTNGDFQTASNQTGDINLNGSRGTMANITLNGASNIDTGSNTKMFATVSMDSVQEFRILTSNYQAQYGKAGGAQISVVTKSGSTEFHGSGYWYYRDKGLNANSWTNNRDGQRRGDYHFNNFGYTIGGPVYIPGKFNTDKQKLFFFWSNEFQRQLVPQGRQNVTMPTLLERAGDFSKSKDSSGRDVIIQDWTTKSPFPDNKIPVSRQFQPGMALLKWLPEPNYFNSAVKNYNYTSQDSSQNPRQEQLLRMDYNATDKWRIFGSWANLAQDKVTGSYCVSGYSLCPNFPITPMVYDHPGYVLTLNATGMFNATTSNEILFDIGHHPVTVLPQDASKITRAGTGIDLPTLYKPYQDWIPQFTFGGTRIGNSPNTNTGGGAWTPFSTYNTTIELADNFSKLLGPHFLKMGAYMQRSRKNQSAYAVTGGNYSFGDSSSNPYDTGFGFANAAIGAFSQFQQAQQYLMGQYRYTNAEFYFQDTWKATKRLTIDAGVRAYYIQPQYDQGHSTSNFLPSLFDPAKAQVLYRPVMVNGVKMALNPITGETTSSLAIGKLIPGVGDPANGLAQGGQKGVNNYLMKVPSILWAPRVGLAFDLTGRQNLVLRLGAGRFYDRYQGNEIFNLINNPPANMQTTIVNGLASNISANSPLNSVAGITAIDYSGKIPTIYNWSAGIQAKLPGSMTLDVAYVGSQSQQLLFNQDLNSVPFGAAFLPQNQDPTKSATAMLGSSAYDSQFLRPYQGYGGITMQSFGATANYNSLQATVNRRFASGLFLAANYTWSKCMTTADNDGAGFNLYDTPGMARNYHYGRCGYDVPHNLNFTYVYPLPKVSELLGWQNGVSRRVLDGWQVSGLTVVRNGNPTTVMQSISGAGAVNLHGSNTQLGSLRAVMIGNPWAGVTDDPYNRINPAAFAVQSVGTLGFGQQRNMITTPGVINFDMALQKMVPVTERTHIELKAEAFNVFNNTQFSGLNSTINFSGLVNPTVTNLPYDSTGKLVNRGGFGTISGARTPRIMQLVAKFVF